MVKKITEPAKSIFRFYSPQAQGILHSALWGLGRCLISEVLYWGMLKTRSFWWGHVLQEVWDQQEVCGLFALIVVLGSSSDQWLWWEGVRCCWGWFYIALWGAEGDRSQLSFHGILMQEEEFGLLLCQPVVRALCNNRFLRKHPWAKQGRPCVWWDLFPAGCDPVRGLSWLDWGDSVGPPCPCMVPPAGHREGWSLLWMGLWGRGKQEALAETPVRILAGGGRKDLSLHCGSSGGVMRRRALMCRNAACQNDYSANLFKSHFLCATLKFIRQLKIRLISYMHGGQKIWM